MGSSKGAVFIQEHKHQLVEVVLLPGVIRVGLNNQLLARLVADQPVRPGANRLLRVGFGVVFICRDNPQGTEHIDERALRRLELDTHSEWIHRLSLEEVAHIDLATTGRRIVVGVSHVLGGQWRAVGELEVGLELEGPGLAIRAGLIIAKQKTAPGQILVLLEQRAVQQQIAAVAPAQHRVEAFGWFIANGQLQGAVLR